MNIKYLKYFYHLFPTHLNKFYSLFHKYVSPKIEQLKSYINELYSQNKSIASEITNLGKTKQSIEDLSKLITFNVSELKKTIGNSGRFNQFVEDVKSKIKSKLEEIKAMDKTSSITEALEQCVKQIQPKAQEKLKVVNQKIQQHQQEFKQKICQQVGHTKEVLQQLDNGGKGMIKVLEPKIQELVGNRGVANGGRLGKLLSGISKIGEKRLNTLDVFKEGVPIRDAAVVMIAVRNIWLQKSYYTVLVTQAISHLRYFQSKLKEFQEGNVISEISRYNKWNIDEYKNKIKEHQNELWKLEQLSSSHQRYIGYMKRMRNLIKHLKFLKLKENKGKLCDRIQNIVDGMEDIQYSELEQINREIGQIIDKAKTAYRDLEKTEKMFEYLSSVKEQENTIKDLSINGTNLREIETTIRELQSAYESTKESNEKIKAAKNQLQEGFEEDPSRSEQGQLSNGEKENMMPGDLDLNVKENEFQKSGDRLTAIQTFNKTLGGIQSGMTGLDGNSQGPNGSDVKGTLEWLGTIDGTLSKVYGHVNIGVSKMKGTYSKYQEQINATTPNNGTNIKGHVASIGQIPDEILKLQSKVRYSKVLLNIAKSVDDTKPSHLKTCKKEDNK